MNTRCFAGLLILSTVLLSASYYSIQNDLRIPSALDFNIIDGRRLSPDQLRGKPVLINFWSTSCKSCIQELPDLFALYNEFSSAGLEIIGVTMPYDRPDIVLKVTDRHQIPYPVALDVTGEISRAFGNVSVTPTHFLITPEGQIAEKVVGMIDPDKLRNRIKTMLELQSE